MRDRIKNWSRNKANWFALLLCLALLGSGVKFFEDWRDHKLEKGKKISKLQDSEKKLANFWRVIVEEHPIFMEEIARACGKPAEKYAIPEKYKRFVVEPPRLEDLDIESLSIEELTRIENKQALRSTQYLPLLKFFRNQKWAKTRCDSKKG